ncbi:SH3 domain-containing protein [Carboxydothermus pertinax]|uniref:SH3 domain-containing protein n=1 Tax=Carboxydothermus pertinax TaxID=870242 RepID=A0A1L8CTI1_9THEO|nr:SH3 domain-containing protein [Carboxydothermus pertinax]GAV22164.1 SH3 domain-containing protein [Carboxydothermus pertinax]
MKKGIYVILGLIIAFGTGFFVGGKILAQNDGVIPGSPQDPLVAKSYVDKQIKAVTDQVYDLQARIAALEKKIAELSAPKPSTTTTTTTTTKTGIVTVDKLYLRKTPQILSTNVITKLSKNTRLTVYLNKSNSTWYYVKTPTGAYGYVSKSYVKLQ